MPLQPSNTHDRFSHIDAYASVGASEHSSAVSITLVPSTETCYCQLAGCHRLGVSVAEQQISNSLATLSCLQVVHRVGVFEDSDGDVSDDDMTDSTEPETRRLHSIK